MKKEGREEEEEEEASCRVSSTATMPKLKGSRTAPPAKVTLMHWNRREGVGADQLTGEKSGDFVDDAEKQNELEEFKCRIAP